ncbi:MAG: hypothetical protein D4R97_04480 [Bacteroidetes bacterium]|nr:MAG: hypothetical protein D4R97_04480 [Bacteroidota bacterium]
MKSIKFTDDELDFLLDQYQMELEEAEKYVESLRNIIKKLGNPKPKKVAEPVEKQPKKRGRKPKLIKEQVLAKPIKKARKPRKDKGKGRRKGVKLVKPTVESKAPVIPATESKPPKKVVLKKKAKKKRNIKSKKVVLAPLSKPLKPKPVVESPPATETTPEKVEENLTS